MTNLKHIFPFKIYDDINYEYHTGIADIDGNIIIEAEGTGMSRSLDPDNLFYRLDIGSNYSVIVSSQGIVSRDIKFDTWSIEYAGDNMCVGTVNDTPVLFNLEDYSSGTITGGECSYPDRPLFVNGYTRFKINGKYQFIDKKGENTSGNIFDEADGFYSFLPPTLNSTHAVKDGLHYIANYKGEIISKGYKDARWNNSFLIIYEGRAAVNDKGVELTVPEGEHWNFKYNYIEKIKNDKIELCDNM
jgi:hypothetical protein